MPWYPECSNTPEDGPNWTPSISWGEKPKRLREGGNSAALPPKASLMADKAALQFHKKQAIKHGIDTPKGMAHLDQMKTHMGNINKSKQKMQDDAALQQQAQPQQGQPQQPMAPTQAPQQRVVPKQSVQPPQAGAAGKSNPVPGIPSKKDQPSEDIRQDKPLIRLRQQEGAEGGPGSGPRRKHDFMNPDVKSHDQLSRYIWGTAGSHKGDINKSAKMVAEHFGIPEHRARRIVAKFSKSNESSKESAIRSFGREANEGGPGSGPSDRESRTRESGEFQYNNPGYEPPKRIPGWSAGGMSYSPPVAEVQKSLTGNSNIKEF